jgi:hypothetical protein
MVAAMLAVLAELRECPACGQAFLRSGRKTFCSTRCHSRLYMRAYRKAAR